MGANVDVQGFEGKALQAALAEGGHGVIVKFIPDTGRACGRTGRIRRKRRRRHQHGGHDAIIQLLLEQEADVNAQRGMYYRQHRHMDTVRSLGCRKSIERMYMHREGALGMHCKRRCQEVMMLSSAVVVAGAGP